MLVRMSMYLYNNDVDDRYWGAGISWRTNPGMSRKDRERLIHRKYVLKEWISTSETWELDMQKQYPLDKDELAVLDYVKARKRIESKPNQEKRVQCKPSEVETLPPLSKQRQSRSREAPAAGKREGKDQRPEIQDGPRKLFVMGDL